MNDISTFNMAQQHRIFLALVALGACFLIADRTSAQSGVAIGAGSPTPASCAALDVQSTTQGALIPRMTSAQRNAIAAPAQGLTIYDTTVGDVYYFDGTLWRRSDQWHRTGSEVSITGNVGINTLVPSYPLDCNGTGRVQGFTTLGDGAETSAVKMKLITGTLAWGIGISHGLDASKIIGVEAMAQGTDGAWYCPGYDAVSGYRFHWYADGATIRFDVDTQGASAQVLNQPVKLLVTYRQ